MMLSITLSGCNQNAFETTTGPKIDQDNICQVKDWSLDATMEVCKPGQKVVFLPASFGNEQLPIMFAAVNCDLRYNVALTTGAVTCIYNPIKPKKPDANTAK